VRLYRRESQIVFDRLQCRDAELDVFIEIHVQVGRAAVDVVPVHRRRERRLLHFFLHAGGFHPSQPLRTDQCARRQKSAQLVAGV
jgi:hypothetical protein